MFAITGASGQLGRLVIERLLERAPAGQVVAAMRDQAKGADLSRLGVLLREADYKRPATLSKAFEGVDRVLLISSTEVVGRLPLHCVVIDAAQAQVISLFAYTSMLHADTSPARLAIEHRQTEEAIKSSSLPVVIFRNGRYTENHLAALPSALEHGALFGAASDGRFSSAARADYALAAAIALTSEGQAGHSNLRRTMHFRLQSLLRRCRASRAKRSLTVDPAPGRAGIVCAKKQQATKREDDLNS